MSRSFSIVDAVTKVMGVLWGTKASDASQGETVDVTDGKLHVTVLASPASALPLDSRTLRFDAAGDMPADITANANVASKRVKLDSFPATARRIRLIWHGADLAGPDTQATQQFFGEVALGARVTINAPDDVTANQRLTYTDLTGGGTSSSGVPDTFIVSKTKSEVDLSVNAAITRIDVIGIPNGLAVGAELDKALPSLLEVQVLG